MMSQRRLSLTNAKKSHEQFALKFLGVTVHKVPRDLAMNYLQNPDLSKIYLYYHVMYMLLIFPSLFLYFCLFSFHLKIKNKFLHKL